MENKPEKQRNKPDDYFAIRHSVARYQKNKEIVESDEPERGFDPKEQDFLTDLTPEGVKFAEQEAEKFFEGLDPKKDALFFASSNLVRAMQTANIYRKIAKEKGFEIIRPEKPGTKLGEKIGEGDIRVIDTLSLGLKNMLVESIFFPDKDYLEEVVKDKKFVSEETRKKWKKAREIIENDNKGSWGANHHYHSKKIKEIFPYLKTSEDLYEQKFKNLLRLIEFADKKIKEANLDKNIKVLGFGHENYFLHFLDKYFKEPAIGNCEVIGFRIEEDGIQATAKGESKKID